MRKPKHMRLIAANGKLLTIGSAVKYDGGARYTIDKIEGDNIGLISGCHSFDMVDPEAFGARWHEEDFVEYFFASRNR
jgi:hypothetical protein